jgi:hypothetical protein
MIDQLIQSLEIIEPLELEAVSLLQSLRPQTGEWFPTSLTPEAKTQVIAATVELVSYTKRCADMARRLSHLQPIPLAMPLMEFAI